MTRYYQGIHSKIANFDLPTGTPAQDLVWWRWWTRFWGRFERFAGLFSGSWLRLAVTGARPRKDGYA